MKTLKKQVTGALEEADLASLKERELKVRELAALDRPAVEFEQSFDRTLWLLNKYPAARDQTRVLLWIYWQLFDGIRSTIDLEVFLRTTPAATITRHRAYIQNTLGLFVPSKTVRKHRQELEEKYSKDHVGEVPETPWITAHLDESGKTEDVFVIGSVWSLDLRQMIRIIVALNQKLIEFGLREFHAKKARSAKEIAQHKWLIDFIANEPTLSVRGLVVKNKQSRMPFDQINAQIYILLTQGIDDEIERGRISTPLSLDVVKDRDHATGDVIALEFIKERFLQIAISEANQTDEIPRISPRTFRAEDSRHNSLVQAADTVAYCLRRIYSEDVESNELSRYFDDTFGVSSNRDRDDFTVKLMDSSEWPQ